MKKIKLIRKQVVLDLVSHYIWKIIVFNSLSGKQLAITSWMQTLSPGLGSLVG